MSGSRAVVMAVVVTAAFTAASGTGAAASASYRSRIPWNQQTVYAFGPDHNYLAEWNGPGAGWTIIGGPGQQVVAGSAGVFEIDDSGDIEQYSGTPGNWTVIGGPGDQFVEGGGHLYAIGPNDAYVAEWNGPGAGWTIIGDASPGARLYAGPAGLVMESASDLATRLYDGSPNQWTQISGPSGSVGVGSAIYRTDADSHTVEQWAGGTAWTTIRDYGGVNMRILAAGGAGLVVAYGDDTHQFKYGGTPGSWSEIAIGDYGDPGVFPLSISDTNIYGGTIDSAVSGQVDTVDLYSGSGMSWTVIGGPAAFYPVAGD